MAISVGSLIAALAFWFAALSVPTNPITGLLILGVGLAFAMYSVAGFSGATDLMGTGFAAAITALVAGAALVILAQAVDSRAIFVLSPVVAISAGGIRALAPTRDKQRNLVRLAASAVVVVALYLVFTVEVSAFGLVAPLLPLPALGIADRFYDRGREIVAEDI